MMSFQGKSSWLLTKTSTKLGQYATKKAKQ